MAYGRWLMTPSEPTSAAEWKVIKVFFGIAFAIAIIFIAWSWRSQSRECAATCTSQGFKDGSLHLKGGSKINAGSYCECLSH
jgi:hypothetical protein